MAMEFSIVIKVKYEETIRRFNARVVNEKLDLNMNALREKIFKLFNFAPDSELTLTYLDEDGDAITLVDDEDLLDVVKQDLNPLRIAVSLKAAERSSGPSARSSGNSTPLRSPRVQPPFPNLNAGVSDALKSVPEPLRETVIKLYSDISSRASSSAPILAELVDGISKMGLSYYQNQASVTQPVKESSFHSGASNGNTMTADGGNPKSNSGVPSLEKNEPQAALNDERTSKATEPKSKSLNQAVDTLAKITSKLKGVEADQTETLGSSSKGPKAHTMPAKTVGKLTQLNWGTRNGDSSGSSVKVPNDGSRSPFRLMQIPTNEVPPSFSWMPKNVPPLIPANECPFSGVPNDPLPPPFEVPLKRSHNHSDGTGTIFHRGVRCDGCGVHPITGPRFISKVKENYDLCSICFAEMGNDADYIRVDRPLTYRHPLSFKGLHDLHARLRPPAAPQVLRGFKLKPGRPKLDSRFIQDVNVLDGTLMAPLTRFTKIWRMRNNGNLIWPQGTQLVWIGGDRLSDRFSVELEISPAGLAVDQKLDVAVDFVAPELPGRYISYWRMASPSGQKFGQRVWVLIQVDVSSNLPKKELVHEAFQGLNLNFPPANNGLSGPDIINVNPEPQDALPEPKGSKTAMELVESVADVSQNNEQEAKFPINDSLLVGVGDKSGSSLAPAPGSSISYPIIDMSEVAPPAAIDMQAPPLDVRGNNDVEMSLLRELEEMGFKQIDLNKEILRKNEYDLEQSVDDLCGVSEWDPILEELEEMGFCDKEMNKKLLEKNNGSIKRVVMDLIAGEK